LRRSNTLGRVDTHAQAQSLRRPLAENKSAGVLSPSAVHSSLAGPASFFQLSAPNPAAAAKLEQYIVCLECKEVVERVSKSQEQERSLRQLHQQLASSSGDDDDSCDEDGHVAELPMSSRERRLRLTKSLVLS
jgi:hypothetical protein